jgi:hypothetical protein
MDLPWVALEVVASIRSYAKALSGACFTAQPARPYLQWLAVTGHDSPAVAELTQPRERASEGET